MPYFGTEILWGLVPDEELPKLPEGFRYEKQPGCWVLAISPEAEYYYVGPTKLYPRRQRKDTGTYFIDTENGVIQIPEKDHGKQTS